ncbi:16S rRNA (cytidine(1402)-2'-O)-methyltransferase [Cumulibacter manganitolerans]|uniref:16S rRNA (cytidine(1402)-2'-O)-methyltransferase n=1 Tax=Cumulibacter manganitolerans TaxID=1884992 RepID=UPI0012953C91|nr:16S rRNA (cytidine(1402)-2'-O)-methyltransferase [Cumulibacter manganitolerans]
MSDEVNGRSPHPADRAIPPGTLAVAGTPLGNRGDATDRLRAALADADVVAAEDTRRTRRLAADLDVVIRGRLVSYYDQVEAQRAPELVEALRGGQSVLLVTDAGMPSVSDPGYRIVEAAVAAGLLVTCLPGPSAVTVALALSGLPSDRFCFEGFLPRKPGERARLLAELATERRTVVLFEAPHRIEAMLRACADALGGDRRAAVCRELTKTYEEVRRGTLAELADWAADGVRGEITVVIAGAGEARGLTTGQLVEMVEREVASGSSKKDAVALVAASTGTPKRTVFEAYHSR